jgi:wyosine [tRNA(Phe)-imidazoG37] synthetase (radical SAM superfamily)
MPKNKSAGLRNMPEYIYGPVPSRRLGFSLGVDILPYKTCSMDCIYCQLGASPKTTLRRREFIPTEKVVAQIKGFLRSGKKIDAITFSGSGEPTLHSGIGRMIHGIKKISKIPVVVLTNSSVLASAKGQKELFDADIVVPSLDAATPEVFKKTNRPHHGLTVKKIIDGLVRFRQEYKGRIWLEVMLVKGINDNPAHLAKLKRAIAKIQPDKIQLNTVVRPPAEKFAKPLTRAELNKIRTFFGENTEIIADFKRGGQSLSSRDAREAILATVRRRPVTARDISLYLGMPLEEIQACTDRLVEEEMLKRIAHKGKEYYEPCT